MRWRISRVSAEQQTDFTWHRYSASLVEAYDTVVPGAHKMPQR